MLYYYIHIIQLRKLFMATIIADTHKLILHLQTKGFSKEQAEGISDALSEIDETRVVSEAALERALHSQTRQLLTFIMTIAAAQTALTVTLIELLG